MDVSRLSVNRKKLARLCERQFIYSNSLDQNREQRIELRITTYVRIKAKISEPREFRHQAGTEYVFNNLLRDLKEKKRRHLR